MESQMAPTIWLPTICHLNPALNQMQDPSAAINKSIIRPLVATQQPVLLPSHTGHVIVQMQPILPVLTGDSSPLPVQPCREYVPPNLMLHSFPCLPQFNHVAGVMESPAPQVLTEQVRRKLSIDMSSHSINKAQKKKKISPSAKRRSRMRLIAFLEAKKEKCTNQEQDGALELDSDATSNGTSSDPAPSPHIFPDGKTDQSQHSDPESMREVPLPQRPDLMAQNEQSDNNRHSTVYSSSSVQS